MTYPWRGETKIAPKDEPCFVALQAVEMQIGDAEGCGLSKGSFVGRLA